MHITLTISFVLSLCLNQWVAAEDAFGPRRGHDLADGIKMAWSAGNQVSGAYQQNQQVGTKSKLSPRTKILLAALVPGLPQFLDGKPRAWAYFGVEGASIGGLLWLNSRGNSYENRYVILARTARGNFVYPGMRNNPTEDVDMMAAGYGEYYEDLLKWQSSGDYDNDPNQPGVQPETDPRTFNGHQWEIAKINNYTGTDGGIPVPSNSAEEQAALDSYVQRVYDRELNWDWTGLDTENDEYHRLFDRSESSYRKRSNFAAALIANHIVSVLDVLITERINSSESLSRNGVNLGLQMYMPAAGNNLDQVPMLVVGKMF